MMGAEGHRRLIGNDVGVIFYLDGDFQLDPTHISLLGTVPQVFGVVQRFRGGFRCAESLYVSLICSDLAFSATLTLNHSDPKSLNQC